ncbi:hypothetical protein Tco_0011805, partial [Tanacetum coccineum]
IRTTPAQQITKDNALVALENRREIGKCNLQIDLNMKRPKEITYQVVVDALALSTCYQACLITVEVPSSTCINSGHNAQIGDKDIRERSSISQTLLLIICINYREHLRPSSTHAFSGNNCLEQKASLQIQISNWHSHKKNVDFVALIWEDLAYQIENKNAKKTYKMYYPRFTKAIISHYIKQNPSISLRNKLFMHTTRDDTILGFLKFVSKNEDVQVYGALIPKVMMNQEMLSSKSFQTYYAIATSAAPPKTKKQRKADSSKSFEDSLTRKSPRIKRIARDEHDLKRHVRRSGNTSHNLQASGSGSGANEGTDEVDVEKSDNEGNNDDNDDEDNENDNDSETMKMRGNDDVDNIFPYYFNSMSGSLTWKKKSINSNKMTITDEVKGQLNKILPKKIADVTTPMIKRNVVDLHERVILLDKMHDIESYRGAQEHRDLYECLAKSYKLDKDIFDTYGEGYSLKRDRDDQDKDEDPSAGSDRGKKGGNQEKRQNLLRNQSQKILSLRVRLKAPPNLHASQLVSLLM